MTVVMCTINTNWNLTVKKQPLGLGWRGVSKQMDIINLRHFFRFWTDVMIRLNEQQATRLLDDPFIFCMFLQEHYGLTVQPAPMRRAGIVSMSAQQWAWFKIQWT